jgi:hypothetical protein
MKYYLQIVKDNVSILVDSDVGYYHQFKIDDVIEVVMNDELQLGFQTQHLGISLNIRDLIVTDIVGKEIYNANGWIIQNPRFTIDWDKKDYQQLSIASALMNGYMMDVTKGVERKKKKEKKKNDS